MSDGPLTATIGELTGLRPKKRRKWTRRPPKKDPKDERIRKLLLEIANMRAKMHDLRAKLASGRPYMADYRKRYAKALHQRLRDAGICTRCRKPIEAASTSSVRCLACNVAHAQKCKRQREQRRHPCATCRNGFAIYSDICHSCAARRWQRLRREKLAALGGVGAEPPPSEK